MKIYFAAPLFNEIELERNRILRSLLVNEGHVVYLPQDDGGISYDLIKQGKNITETRKNIFHNDIDEIKKCDIIICVLDGRVPDEGMCVELGFAYALGKICIGFSTDNRALDKFGNSLMIDGCLSFIAYTKEELLLKLKELKLEK